MSDFLIIRHRGEGFWRVSPQSPRGFSLWGKLWREGWGLEPPLFGKTTTPGIWRDRLESQKASVLMMERVEEEKPRNFRVDDVMMAEPAGEEATVPVDDVPMEERGFGV